MANGNITITVKVAWWLKPYLYAVGAFSRLTGMTPDMGKVGRMLKRGLTIEGKAR